MAAIEISWKGVFYGFIAFLSIIYGSCIVFSIMYKCDEFKNSHVAPKGWLIVKGSIGLLFVIVSCISFYLQISTTKVGDIFRKYRSYAICVIYLIGTFLAVWQVIGTSDVLGYYDSGPNYAHCHRNIVIFSWTSIITIWIMYYFAFTVLVWKSINIGYDKWT
jgi:hypothetical protein